MSMNGKSQRRFKYHIMLNQADTCFPERRNKAANLRSSVPSAASYSSSPMPEAAICIIAPKMQQDTTAKHHHSHERLNFSLMS